LLAFNEQRDLEANASNMDAAAKRVKTGEITTATRSVEFNGVTVEQGQTIGLLNDELTVAGKSIDDAVWQLLEQMQIGELEIVTLYYGHDILKATAEILGEAIRSKYPHLEVEVVEGGQPHYSYIISAE
ncbi:MAG TPA: DAK2 domain-containing protein, partial [Anaerolineae bacterium]|nr:DAK2 domain-containing protein [Anaerolineae bacterium]